MAHFAQIVDGVVQQVLVVDNKDCDGGDFPESEPVGQGFLAELGFGGVWLQCSYSGAFRRHMPGGGYLYEPDADVFYPASPGKDWTLDTESWQWVNGRGVRFPRD